MPFSDYSNKSSGGTSRWGGSSSSGPDYSTDSLDKQIGNANSRIQDAGYTPQDTDTRNWFEKATNLPQGQNGFLDALELLGRPGSAIKNVLDKSVLQNTSDNTAENPLTAAWKGLSGQDRVTGVDLSKKMFGDNGGVGNFLIGTGLDIGLDPTTYIPGGLIAKGIGSVAKPLGSLAKGAYDAIESASPALQGFRSNVLEPTFNAAKDTLGRAFVPQYKWDETLTGGTDETLKNLYRDTNNTKDFMNEEALNNIGNIAKTTGIDAGTDVGRLMEKDLVANGPRPFRQLSNDPEHLQATQDLIDSNDELRKWATDNDIPVGEIDGYMRHILSQEERNFRKTTTGKNIDRSTDSINNPDKHVLDNRKYTGSAEDVNDQMGRKMFEDNAYFATAIGQKKLIDYGNAVKFRRDILSNPEFAQKYTGGSVADHHELIDTNNYQFMKNPNNSLPDEIGGKYVVTKGVKESLDRFQGLTTDEGTKGMIKAYDTVQNTWKKMALFSPGFHIRNVAGAMFNNAVAGMNPYQLVKYTKDAGSEVMNAIKGNESAMFREYRAQGLSSSGISKVEFAKAGEAPELGIQRTVENMSKTGMDKAISKLKTPFQTSQEVGDAADQVNRYALYKWSRDKGMTPEQAAAKVKEVQYDYSDLTPFERNVMKRAVPFYTWSRKNIPFQLKSFINDPRPYMGIDKISKNAQSAAGLDENNMPDFMKENFTIPVSKSQMLGLNLPLGDLTKLTNPLKLAVDGISPLVKTPIELATNYSMFKGKPIEKFAGQDKKYIGGLGIPAKLDYAIQAATGQIGKGLSGYLGDTGNADQDNKFRTPSLGLSVVKPYDAQKSAYYQKLDELKKLQDFMLYIQQQTGEKPRTSAEIKKNGGSGRW